MKSAVTAAQSQARYKDVPCHLYRRGIVSGVALHEYRREQHELIGACTVVNVLGSSCTVPLITVDVRIETFQWVENLHRVRVADLCRTAARITVVEVIEGEGIGIAALSETGLELTIVLTDDTVVQTLNRVYRGENKPTNVLSFSILEAPDFPIPGEALALGDVIIALQTTQREAEWHDIPFADYFCHLVVHGVLHLLGYDHQEGKAAEEMERLEDRILSLLGMTSPYDSGASTTPDHE